MHRLNAVLGVAFQNMGARYGVGIMYSTRYEVRRPIFGVPELISELAKAIAKGTEVVIELEEVEGDRLMFNVRVNDGPFCATFERVAGVLS